LIRSTLGRQNSKADALTRRSQDLTIDASDPCIWYQKQSLKSQNLSARNLELLPLLAEEPFEYLIARMLEGKYTAELDDKTGLATWHSCYFELVKPDGVPHL